MKTKTILFGLIKINATLYNILYTLLCVCVLVVVFYSLIIVLYAFKDDGLIEGVGFIHVLSTYAITGFLAIKIMSKKHYA